MLRLILNSLRSAPGRLFLLAIPIALGSLCMAVLASTYLGTRSLALASIAGLEPNEIIVSPQAGGIPFFGKSGTKTLTDKDIETIRAIRGVASIQIRRVLQGIASVRITVLGQALESDTPIYGITDGEGVGAFSSGGDAIPVLLSRSFVALMGTTLADSLGFPRLDGDLLVGHELEIVTGYSSFFPSRTAGIREWPARIVGLSPRVPFAGLSIPMEDLERIASEAGSSTKISELLLTLSPDADLPSVRRGFETLGLSTDSLSSRLGLIQERMGLLLTLLSSIGTLLLAFVIVTTISVVWSDVLLHTRQIGIMRSFGAASRHIRTFFLGKVMIVSLLSSMVGTLLGTLLVSWAWQHWGTGLPDLDLLPFGAGHALMIALASVSVLTIVTLLSSLPPILRANRFSPIGALGEEP